jgi:DNA-binding transcriptional ArsR family regulator
MSSYSELIKNFEKIRAYMRDFYIYGFKSRDEYDQKSARSYDDERRRMESWLGEHMSFVRTPEGKRMFISIDSRISEHNPLYKAWKAKSFTDGDITLHFILFDILHSPEVQFSIPQLMDIIDRDYLSHFQEPILFDQSTVRKKLKEYEAEGLIVSEKAGRQYVYHRADSPSIPQSAGDALHYFSETLPCGVIGSYILDRQDDEMHVFRFKHHYITSTLDSDILATLFYAMRSKRSVTLRHHSRHTGRDTTVTIVPLRVFISTQNGRQHLLAYYPRYKQIASYRVDYLSDAKLGEPYPEFDALREKLDGIQKYIWSVNCKKNQVQPEHAEFILWIPSEDKYILKRLEREKRNGIIEPLGNHRYRFSVDLYDSSEIIPWVRTFIGRIEQMNFSNRTVENQIKRDLEKMYHMYDIGGGDDE